MHTNHQKHYLLMKPVVHSKADYVSEFITLYNLTDFTSNCFKCPKPIPVTLSDFTCTLVKMMHASAMPVIHWIRNAAKLPK